MSNDSFYTPDEIAASMLGKCTLDSPARIVDFAAGDGALLRRAVAQWPTATVFATDINPKAVRSLQAEFPSWNISKCDFMSASSRAKAQAIESLAGRGDVVLLNPPFSYRGAATFPVNAWQETFHCSKAMAFVLLSLEHLTAGGQLIAILPESSLFGDKDARAWEAVKQRFTVTRGATAGRGVFSGCAARCTIVRLTQRKRKQAARLVVDQPNFSLEVTLVRGSVPLYLDTGSDRTLVHSTDLQQSSVILNGHVASSERPSVCGPSVMIHRVGMPSIEKVALYLRRKRVTLSDCVIGLQCNSSDDAIALHNLIKAHETEYKQLYAGTCAPYTTVQRVVEFLNGIGCQTTVRTKNRKRPAVVDKRAGKPESRTRRT